LPLNNRRLCKRIWSKTRKINKQPTHDSVDLHTDFLVTQTRARQKSNKSIFCIDPSVSVTLKTPTSHVIGWRGEIANLCRTRQFYMPRAPLMKCFWRMIGGDSIRKLEQNRHTKQFESHLKASRKFAQLAKQRKIASNLRSASFFYFVFLHWSRETSNQLANREIKIVHGWRK
jgi:hypothetical protein